MKNEAFKTMMQVIENEALDMLERYELEHHKKAEGRDKEMLHAGAALGAVAAYKVFYLNGWLEVDEDRLIIGDIDE